MVYFNRRSFKMNSRKKSSLHSEGSCSNLAEEFAESSNFSVQESGLFLSASLLLLSDLKRFCQVGIFHIELLEQQIRSCALFKLERGESHSVLYVSRSQATPPALPSYSSTRVQTSLGNLTNQRHVGCNDRFCYPGMREETDELCGRENLSHLCTNWVTTK